MRQALLTISLVAAAFGAAVAPVYAQKTDTVVLLNGDRYTCEIKQLERGLLHVKTDDAGTLDVKWHRIASVDSPTPFDIETERGARFVGTLRPSTRPGALDIEQRGTIVTLDMTDVVFMAPVKNRFWSRLTGSVSLGFSFASANSKSDWSFDSQVKYRGVGYENQLNASSAFSTQQDAASNSRNSITVASERRFKGLWVYLGLASLQQNQELGLDLRAAGAGGFGRIFVQSNRAAVGATAGLAVTREYFTGEDGQTSLEAFTQLRADWFRLDSPKLDISTIFTLLPSLTQAGRVRSEFNATLKVEILFSNFFWSLSGFDSADSRPPVDTLTKHDYGVTTSFGYTF